MSGLDSYLGNFEYNEGTFGEDLQDVIQNTEVHRVERLLKETKEAFNKDLLNLATITLWCAASEQLKEYLYMYDNQDLCNASYIGDIESYSDLNDEKDAKLLKAADDLGLINSSNLPLVQAVYKKRCAVAHGDKVETTEKKIAFCLSALRTSIFSKSDAAGINAEVLIRLINSGKVPRKYFESVDGFNPEDQHKLVRKLFEMRKDLPPARMDVRDPYLEGYTRTDKNRRDGVIEAFDIIWDKLNEDVKRRKIERIIRNHTEGEVVNQFLISYGLSLIDNEERNRILRQFFTGRHSGDFTEQNDVAITLLRAEELKEIDEDNLEEIWSFSCQEFGAQNDPEKTRGFYTDILYSLDEPGKETIADFIVEKIDEKENYNLSEEDFGELSDHTKRLIDFKYIREYFEVFDSKEQQKILEKLRESQFYGLEEVEEFVDDRIEK